MTQPSSLYDRDIEQIQFLIFDVETTGRRPEKDGIVELAAVSASLNSPPKLVFDTLIKPFGPMGATHIHGIEEKDVRNAPNIDKVIPYFAAASANRVLVAHNASFDMQFLRNSSPVLGYLFDAPYICTLELFGLLGYGRQFSLANACGHLGLSVDPDHSARGDALACAKLLRHLLREEARKGLNRLGDLRKKGRASCLSSLGKPFIPSPRCIHSGASAGFIPRKKSRRASSPTAVQLYRKRVAEAVEDLEVGEEEAASVRRLREKSGLTQNEVRAVHAHVFGSALTRYSEDYCLDACEEENLRQLAECLRKLGWAPGDGDFC